MSQFIDIHNLSFYLMITNHLIVKIAPIKICASFYQFEFDDLLNIIILWLRIFFFFLHFPIETFHMCPFFEFLVCETLQVYFCFTSIKLTNYIHKTISHRWVKYKTPQINSKSCKKFLHKNRFTLITKTKILSNNGEKCNDIIK